MENGPFIDGLPIKDGGSFHGYVSHKYIWGTEHPFTSYGAHQVLVKRMHFLRMQRRMVTNFLCG